MASALQTLLALASLLLKLAPLLAAWLAGRGQAISAQRKQALRQAERSHEIDEDVARLDGAALLDELRRQPK